MGTNMITDATIIGTIIADEKETDMETDTATVDDTPLTEVDFILSEAHMSQEEPSSSSQEEKSIDTSSSISSSYVSFESEASKELVHVFEVET